MRLLTILFLTVPLFVFSQNKLTIEVLGVSSSDGDVMVAVYDTSDSFLSKDKVFKTGKASAREGKTEVSIEDMPDGEFAVVLYHDENGNNKLDTNWFGVPKEPVGFSNAKMKTFGPPKFKECVFTMEPVTQIKVAL
ncbi:MAG: DUF2141 domain-containing protein [Flavobacteriaceae bacterium]